MEEYPYGSGNDQILYPGLRDSEKTFGDLEDDDYAKTIAANNIAWMVHNNKIRGDIFRTTAIIRCSLFLLFSIGFLIGMLKLDSRDYLILNSLLGYIAGLSWSDAIGSLKLHLRFKKEQKEMRRESV